MGKQVTMSNLHYPRASLDRIRQALEAADLRINTQGGRDQFMACCPVHDDSTPSLHVTWRNFERGGGVLLCCHGCKAPADQITQALGLDLKDLFDQPLPERDRAWTRSSKSPSRRLAGARRGKLGRLPALLVAINNQGDKEQLDEHVWVETDRYTYTALDSRPVQQVVREECSNGHERHKRFIQVFVSPTGRMVSRKPAGYVAPLYRAPQVAQAIENGDTVWLLEGEKDVATAEQLTLVATTNAQGGKSLPAHLPDSLRDANLVVVLDRDATGWARAVAVHELLAHQVASLAFKLPAVDAEKADFTDPALMAWMARLR